MEAENLPRWLSGLNPRQAEAVTHGSDPLLILAGAGSGKTRVVTSRIAWMVAEKRFHASSILAVTFTNKAASEMRERVSSLVPAASGAMIRTFHSFGAWLLRRNARAAGLSPGFTIYDDDDQVSLLAQILTGLPRRELRLTANRIARAKDGGLTPEDDLSEFSRYPGFADIYRRYDERLRGIGNVDFGDLILLPIRLLQSREEIRERIRARFRAVLVDEYQDTNAAQYQLLKELVGPETWLGVVGDDDQSIYGFRGAEVENILSFPRMFPDTQVVKLEQNYRSTGTILDIASAVVANNAGRLGKTMWTAGRRGEKAVVARLEDHDEEAEWCAARIASLGGFGDTAVLYRTNAQSRVFETVFRRREIPYRIVGTLSFYQREEVKDVLAYLAWIANRRDEVAFRRIANKPARGLGKKSLDSLLSIVETSGSRDIRAALDRAPLKGRAVKSVDFLGALFDRFSSAIADESEGEFEHLGFMTEALAEASGLFQHYRDVDRIENSSRGANLDELVNAAAEYPATLPGLAAFLELVELDQALLEEEESDENRVTLITMHNTKGLEYENVYITGMDEGLFPRLDDDFDDDELEEERRLFYVAITRARGGLAFTCCRRRMLWGRYRDCLPSRFLREIPDELYRLEGQAVLDDTEPADSWCPGMRLLHDDFGPGVVQKRLSNGGHTVIHVLFESGRRATILPEFSSHKIEMLGLEDSY